MVPWLEQKLEAIVQRAVHPPHPDFEAYRAAEIRDDQIQARVMPDGTRLHVDAVYRDGERPKHRFDVMPYGLRGVMVGQRAAYRLGPNSAVVWLPDGRRVETNHTGEVTDSACRECGRTLRAIVKDVQTRGESVCPGPPRSCR